LCVGTWRAIENANPWTDLDEIWHAHPHLFKEGFATSLTPAPSCPGPEGSKTLNAERHIFENCLQNKRC